MNEFGTIREKNLEQFRNVKPLYILGTMYNVLNYSKQRPTEIKPDVYKMLVSSTPSSSKLLQDRRKALYHDDAVRFHYEEVLNSEFYGKPVFIEHSGNPVGKIIDAGFISKPTVSISASNESQIISDLIVLVKIEDDKAIQAICDKKYTSFSVGYQINISSTGKVLVKQFNEVSLVEEPFFEGCDMILLASNNTNEKKTTPTDDVKRFSWNEIFTPKKSKDIIDKPTSNNNQPNIQAQPTGLLNFLRNLPTTTAKTTPQREIDITSTKSKNNTSVWKNLEFYSFSIFL